MVRVRNRLSPFRACCVIALVLLPLMLSGHFHDSRSHGTATTSCGVCLAAHHTPGAKASGQPCLASARQPGLTQLVRFVERPAIVVGATRSGRSPPASTQLG
jgi:hypothetical protein